MAEAKPPGHRVAMEVITAKCLLATALLQKRLLAMEAMLATALLLKRLLAMKCLLARSRLLATALLMQRPLAKTAEHVELFDLLLLVTGPLAKHLFTVGWGVAFDI